MKYTRTWPVEVTEEMHRDLLALKKRLNTTLKQALGRLAFEELLTRYPLTSFERELI